MIFNINKFYNLLILFTLINIILLLLLFINNIFIKNYNKKFNITNKNNFNIEIINKYLILYIDIYNNFKLKNNIF